MRGSNLLNLEITEKCPLKCKHCNMKPYSQNRVMDIEMAREIVKMYSKTKMLRNRHLVCLTGGEPLCHPNFELFYEMVVGFQGFLMMPTCGVHLSKYRGVFKPTDLLQVSVDGDEEMHDWVRGDGVYQKTLDGLASLRDEGVKPFLAGAIFKENKDRLRSLFDLVDEYDCRGIQYGPFIPTGGLHYYPEITPLPLEEFRETVKVLRKEAFERGIMTFGSPQCIDRDCEAQVSMLSVEPDGTYVDCPASHKVLGKYPDEMQDAILTELVAEKRYQNPLDTCVRWF